MEMKEEFKNLPQNEKDALAVLAERDLLCLKTLWDELKQLLLNTHGKLSYQKIAKQLGNIVSPTTIKKYLKQQEGFHMRKNRILPALGQQAMGQRLQWAHTFFVFWKSVKAISKRKTQFVLVHMDEKWFYVCVMQSNNKVLTLIGLEPIDYYAHHKKTSQKRNVHSSHRVCVEQQ